MNVAFDIDPGILATVRQDPDEFVRELRLAAAVKWYELERISQGRAAEIAGVSRAALIITPPTPVTPPPASAPGA